MNRTLRWCRPSGTYVEHHHFGNRRRSGSPLERKRSNSEQFVKDLIAQAKLWPSVGLRMRRGEPSNCHENSRRIASKHPQQYLRCTGYGLSADSIWRPHSWVWDVKRKRIVETTEKRLVYFGMIEVTD